MSTVINAELFLAEMKLAAQHRERLLAKATTEKETALHEGFNLGLIRALRIFQAATGQTYDITGWFNPET